MKFQIKIGGKDYLIEIVEGEEEVKIKVGEDFFSFKKETEKDTRLSKIKFEKRDFKEKKVKAPIGGIISEIFIKEGEFVKEGQKLFSLSAMKMENEILADFDGRIKKILVKKGENVKKDDVLLIGE
jgi:biotin carboxyl carrier protein